MHCRPEFVSYLLYFPQISLENPFLPHSNVNGPGIFVDSSVKQEDRPYPAEISAGVCVPSLAHTYARQGAAGEELENAGFLEAT